MAAQSHKQTEVGICPPARAPCMALPKPKTQVHLRSRQLLESVQHIERPLSQSIRHA